MPFMVTQASSVMMSSPSPTNGAQDLHENLLLIGDAAFPGSSTELNLYAVAFHFSDHISVVCYNSTCTLALSLCTAVHYKEASEDPSTQLAKVLSFNSPTINHVVALWISKNCCDDDIHCSFQM